MRSLVVYDTKYGNTKLVAEKIAQGMRETGGVETSVSDIKQLDLRSLAGFDVLIIGAPVHFGQPSRAIQKFIDNMGKLNLQAKWGAVFDTYLKTDFEKGVKPMEARVRDKVPGLKLVTPGLSIRVDDMKGPVSEGELPKCIDFGRRVVSLVKAEAA